MSRATELTGAPPCMGSTRRWCVRPTSGRCWGLSPPPALRACGWYGHLPCPRHGQPWGRHSAPPRIVKIFELAFPPKVMPSSLFAVFVGALREPCPLDQPHEEDIEISRQWHHCEGLLPQSRGSCAVCLGGFVRRPFLFIVTNGVSLLQTNRTRWPYCHGHALPPSW